MRRADSALGVFGLLLAGVLAVELLPASAKTGMEPEIEAPVPVEAAAPVDAPPPLAAWADVALGRPLFTPDRRAPQAAPGVPDSLPRLAGTIRSDENMLAIFQPTGSGKPMVVGRDATVAGWTVADIADGAVTLTRAGRTDTLRLSYANLPIAPQPSGPPQMVVLHNKRSDPFLQP